MDLDTRWTREAATAWYASLPWLVGANYIPSNAVNELEMFAGATFDEAANDRELGWAAELGLNCVRVFLHDLLWEESGFVSRLDRFLTIAERHGIRVLLVLFDSCWDPEPHAGPQPEPIPGVHNSHWVQAPGAARLADPAAESLLRDYVVGIVSRFRTDQRILIWDVWNEPDNGWGVYADREPADKLARVEALLPRVFAWVREAGATQPTTSALWMGDFAHPTPLQQIQLEQSDVLSFHNYEQPASFLARFDSLKPHGRPILCTEYMARPRGSTFAAMLPVAQEHHMAAIHWGLVTGRTQTRLPWDSWQHPYIGGREPAEWYHDVLQADGTPYRNDERTLLRKLTSRA